MSLKVPIRREVDAISIIATRRELHPELRDSYGSADLDESENRFEPRSLTIPLPASAEPAHEYVDSDWDGADTEDSWLAYSDRESHIVTIDMSDCDHLSRDDATGEFIRRVMQRFG